jgi:hypothetical protein
MDWGALAEHEMEQRYQHSLYEAWLDESEPRKCKGCGYGPVQVERRVIRDMAIQGDAWLCGACWVDDDGRVCDG